MEDKKIKVQIICVTYNQKEYIQETLESIIMQKTNFDFEVLVGDNCSTDGTSEIIEEYVKQHPNIIKHIKRSHNMGALENFMDLCDKATSKYIAFCDGNDFWTDEYKLQKQYDFMEENKDVNICAHKTKILANEDWTLYNQYAKQEFIIPNEKKVPADKNLILSNITYEWPHLSSLFIRWNNDIEIPENLKTNGIIRDMPIIFLYIGKGYMYILDEIMSVNRIDMSDIANNQEAIDNLLLKTKAEFSNILPTFLDYYKTNYNGFNIITIEDKLWANINNYLIAVIKDEYYIKVKLDYFKILITCIDYYKKNYDEFCINALQNRLWAEIKNYLTIIIKHDKWDLLLELKEQYPKVYQMAKNLINEYNMRLTFLHVLGKPNADLLRNRNILQKIKPIVTLIRYIRNGNHKLKNIMLKISRFSFYWIFALVPKKKNLWVFSGFVKNSYMDNTQYFYEYIVKNHSEINAVWLTLNNKVYNQLIEENMPCYKMNSFAGFIATVRAKLAISDHFKMSDYTPKYGYNARTKFVNLWHGVGPKCMKPVGNKISNSSVPGTRLSTDIIVNSNDNIFNRLIKHVKYIFKAPFRELFEEYYGILCPGQPFIDIVANPWHTNQHAQILCGYPRNIIMYENINKKSETYKILYAPTYRWEPMTELSMVKDFIKNIAKINEVLEKIDATFAFRLHPHTWRDYASHINRAISAYPRFEVSSEKDIYASLHEYSQLITDYSSISYDYLVTQKPIVYFAFDIDTYEKTDTTFSFSITENTAGDITKTWEETIYSIEQNYYNPERHKELRKEILEKFFPSEYNDINNSQRLCEALKMKLKIK